jgi:adenylosuccinate synthase
MTIDVIVGGQAGDEGKGKLAAYLALERDYSAVIRTSSPQSGHTLVYRGQRVGIATLPCGFYSKKTKVLVGRNAYIYVPKLLKELDMTGLTDSPRVGIDAYATIVTEEHLREERENSNLMKNIGSVGTGSGIARRDKLMRNPNLVFAKDIPELQPYILDTVEFVHNLLAKEKTILLEGDQGFKLSLVHGEYPFVTSRDTTASSFLGEIGVGPNEIRDVYIVFKPYITRVDGRPIKNEITDPEILEWCKITGHEVGTVSGRIRKIGGFDWENAERAIKVNGATKLCFTHMDFFGDFSNEIPHKAQVFLYDVEEKLERQYPHPKINLLSYGPGVMDVINTDVGR